MEPPRLTGFRRPANPFDLEANSVMGPGTLTLSVAQEKLSELTQHIQPQQQQLLMRTTPSSVLTFGMDTVSGRRSQVGLNSGVFGSAPGFGPTPLSTLMATGVSVPPAEDGTTASSSATRFSPSHVANTSESLVASHWNNPGRHHQPHGPVGSVGSTMPNPSGPTTGVSASNSPVTAATTTMNATNEATTTTTTPASSTPGLNSPSYSPGSSLAFAPTESAIDVAMARATRIKDRLLRIQDAIAFRERNPYTPPSQSPQTLLFHADELVVGGLGGGVASPAASALGRAVSSTGAYSFTHAPTHSFSSPSSMSISGHTQALRGPSSLEDTHTFLSECSTALSPFERVRIGKLLGQLVLDIASLSHCIEDDVFAPASPPASSSHTRSGGSSHHHHQHHKTHDKGKRRARRQQPVAQEQGEDGLQEMLALLQRERERRGSSLASSGSQPQPPHRPPERRKTQRPSQVAAFPRDPEGVDDVNARDPVEEAADANAEVNTEEAGRSGEEEQPPPENVQGVTVAASLSSLPADEAGDDSGKAADSASLSASRHRRLMLTPPLRPALLSQSASASGASSGLALATSCLGGIGSTTSASSSPQSGRSGDLGRKAVCSSLAMALLYSPSHDSTSALQTSARESVHDAHPLRRTDDMTLSLSHVKFSPSASVLLSCPLPLASPVSWAGSAGTGGAGVLASSLAGSHVGAAGAAHAGIGGGGTPLTSSPAPATAVRSAPARMQSLEGLLFPTSLPTASRSANDAAAAQDILLQPYLQDYLLDDTDVAAHAGTGPATEGAAAPAEKGRVGRTPPQWQETWRQRKHPAAPPCGSHFAEDPRPEAGLAVPRASSTRAAAAEQLAGGMSVGDAQGAARSPVSSSSKPVGAEAGAAAGSPPVALREGSGNSSLLMTPPRVPLPLPTAQGSRGPSTPLSYGEAATSAPVPHTVSSGSPPASGCGSGGSTPSEASAAAAATAGEVAATGSSAKETSSAGALSRSLSLLRRPRRLDVPVSHTRDLQSVSSQYLPRSSSLNTIDNGASVNFGNTSSLNSTGNNPSHSHGSGNGGAVGWHGGRASSAHRADTRSYSASHSHSTSGLQQHQQQQLQRSPRQGSGANSFRGGAAGAGAILDSPPCSEVRFKRVFSMDSEFPEDDGGSLGATSGSLHAAIARDQPSAPAGSGTTGAALVNPSDSAPGTAAAVPFVAMGVPLQLPAYAVGSGSGGYRSLDSDVSSQVRRVSFSDVGTSVRAVSLGSREGCPHDTMSQPSPPHSPPTSPPYVIDAATVSAFAELLDDIASTLHEFTPSDFEEMGLRFAIPGIRSLDTAVGASGERESAQASLPMLLPLFPEGEQLPVDSQNFATFHAMVKERLWEVEGFIGRRLTPS